VSVSSRVLAEIIGGGPNRSPGPPSAGEMAAILAAAVREHAGPRLRIRRYESDGTAFWRWDCSQCGEYGGGRHHPDAITRAMRHCAEHPEHRSSLLPPLQCREREASAVATHPMLC
jgi:hypothetical protein